MIAHCRGTRSQSWLTLLYGTAVFISAQCNGEISLPLTTPLTSLRVMKEIPMEIRGCVEAAQWMWAGVGVQLSTWAAQAGPELQSGDAPHQEVSLWFALRLVGNGQRQLRLRD